MSIVSSVQNNKISHWGAVAFARAPGNWYVYDSGNASQNAGPERVSFMPPENENVTINLFYRGQPVNSVAAAQFGKVLNNNFQVLTPDEIVQLRIILGSKNVGNNQYSNTEPRGSNSFAACKIMEAKVIELNDEPVLSVRCQFQDINGNPGLETLGIYFEDNHNRGGFIQQIYYEAPDMEEYQKYLPQYQALLKSIQWRKS